MSSGLAKLQLLIELKNKLKGGLDGAKRQVDKACGGMQNKLNQLKAGNIKAFEAIKDQVPGVGRAIGLLTNPYVLATASVLALGGAIVSCVKSTNEWHEQMAQINVTAELSKGGLGTLSDKLLEIGSRNVAPLEEVPKAFNRIISAGLSVNDSLATLEPTLRAAKAGFTDIETVAGAATSVMMSAGVDAKKTFDVLFATQKAGNAEFKDIANYLPKVIPLARNVGFALEETAGAYASLTGSLKPEAASTALEGMMRALSNANIVKNFKGLGINVFDTDTGKARPMLEILNDLNKSMAGLSDKEKMLKFYKLGLDQSATLGFSTLMQNMPKVKSDIDAVVNSAGAAEKAYNDSLTPMENWKILQNDIKVKMIQLGEYFLPFITKAGLKILNIVGYFKDLYKSSAAFRDVLKIAGTILSTMFKMALVPMKQTINIISFIGNLITGAVTKVGDLIAKITGIKGGFKGVYDAIRPYLMWMKQFLGSIADILYDVFTFSFLDAKDKIKNFKMPDLAEIRKTIKIETEANSTNEDFSDVPTDNQTIPTNNPKDNPNSDAKKITGGSQTKNITINIDSFIKGFTPAHQSISGMSYDELERRMTEMFMRVVRSAETAI